MSEITFARAELSDALRISVLLKTVYIQTYAVDGVSHEFANFITQRFSVDHLEGIIKQNPNALLVASFKNNPVGVAELIFDSQCPLRKQRVAELSKLYVLDQFNGQGVGAGLLELTEKTLLEAGRTELFLEVYAENPKAITFYKKYGFTTLGEVDFPMETNTYKNLVMNKKLQEL